MHLGFDALLFSAFLAGVKRTTGLTYASCASQNRLILNSFQAVTFTSTEQRYTPWVGDGNGGFNYAHAIIQNCLAPIWKSVRRVVERRYSDSNKFPGEYVFDFAVVVFGVCTPSLLQCPYLTLPLSAIIILREKTIMQWGFFKVFYTPLFACKCSIFFLPWQFSLTDWNCRFPSYSVFLHLSQEIVNKEVQHNGSQSKVCKCSWKYFSNLVLFYVVQNTLTVLEKLPWIHLYFLGSPASVRMPLKQIDQRCSQSCRYGDWYTTIFCQNGILTQTRMRCKGSWILGYNMRIAQCQKASRKTGKNQ